MDNKPSFTFLLDTLGIIALTGAAITLTAAIWSTGIASETTLFGAFYSCMGISLAAFVVNRVADIARIMLNAPDPKRLRTAAATDGTANALDEASNVTAGKFREAA